MANLYRGNIKGLVFIVSFRIAHVFSKNTFLRIIGFPIWVLYRFFFNWVMGIDISESTCIGKSFVVWHGTGIVIHPLVIIGNNVSIRQNTTIGNRYSGGPTPVIGNNVTIGAGSIILGGISIGDNVVIGAGSVVLHDVPNSAVVVGNPAHIIKQYND